MRGWQKARGTLLCLITAAFLWPAAPCNGQMPVAEGSTIHVYANLLQIPVLVLSRRHQPLPPIDPAMFTVRLGTEPPFHPRVVRREGEDPITLAVLIDGSTKDSLMPSLLEGLSDMVGTQLSGRDRIALYALDGCKLRRFFVMMPISGPLMTDGIQRADTHPPYDPRQPGALPCEKPVGLWDAMDYLTRTLATEPGRRVVLAVTNGHDLGSQVQPDTLRKDANRNGVTIFSVAERHKVPLLGPVLRRASPGWETTSWLAEVSEGSGGMVLETTRNNLPYTFRNFVELLRGRYILEFTRPTQMMGGTTLINISCGQPRAFIRTAGTSMPIADPIARDERVPHGAPAAGEPTPSAIPPTAPGGSAAVK